MTAQPGREPLVAETDQAETIATYREGGILCEIDHLGVGRDSQWGEFAVYRGGELVAEFSLPESGLRAEFRPAELSASTAELIELARAAVAEADRG